MNGQENGQTDTGVSLNSESGRHFFLLNRLCMDTHVKKAVKNRVQGCAPSDRWPMRPATGDVQNKNQPQIERYRIVDLPCCSQVSWAINISLSVALICDSATGGGRKWSTKLTRPADTQENCRFQVTFICVSSETT